MDPIFLLDTPSLGAVLDVVKGFIYVLFVLTALIMTVVILLQEGKGGGLGGAFGGAAADTFGVKAGTVNKFTAYLAAGFLGLALLYAGLMARSGAPTSIDLPPPATPEIPTGGTTAAPSDETGAPADDAAGETPPADAPADAPSGDAPSGDAPAGDGGDGSGDGG